MTVEGPRGVVFHFKSALNRELPLIFGQMAVLPKHWWVGRDFDKPLTDPPLGSGPYRIGHFEFGRSLSLDRVPDVWSKDLPVMRGSANFNTRRTEYFRDGTVALEAFKAGQIDFREENIAKQWATAYDFPAVQKGLVKKELLKHHLPTGMQGFGMNTRRQCSRTFGCGTRWPWYSISSGPTRTFSMAAIPAPNPISATATSLRAASRRARNSRC